MPERKKSDPQQDKVPDGKQPVSDEELLRDRSFHSIVPQDSIAGSALVLVIAIMAFLASLTLSAVVLVNDTARGWQSDIAREVTVQVRPIDGVDITQSVISARQIVGKFSGVEAVSVVADENLQLMLQPWLGSGFDLDQLPVPRLISVRVSRTNPPDYVAMAAELTQKVPGASLDNHRAWLDRLNTMARTTIVVGILVFALMMAATVLTVVFATRGAMAGNRHIIEVLHFVGAERAYIAGQFQKHFLLLGLKGALAGGVLAIIALAFFGAWVRGNEADPSAEQVTAFFGTFSVGLAGYVGTGMLIFFIAMLTAITSRLTVFRHVGTLDQSAVET